MNKLTKWLAISILLITGNVQAENMIMLRVSHSFDNTMILIKEKLNDYGYKIAHIQKCDGGLSDFGYKTDFYKSIFFGKFEEMRHLTKNHPEIIPYVPLKIAVMQEKILWSWSLLTLKHCRCFSPIKNYTISSADGKVIYEQFLKKLQKVSIFKTKTITG